MNLETLQRALDAIAEAQREIILIEATEKEKGDAGTQLFSSELEVNVLLECHDDHGFAPQILVSMF